MYTYADDVAPEQPTLDMAALLRATERLRSLHPFPIQPSPFSPWTWEEFHSPGRWMVRAPTDQLPEGVTEKLDALGIPSRPESSRFLPPGTLAVIFDGGRIVVVHADSPLR